MESAAKRTSSARKAPLMIFYPNPCTGTGTVSWISRSEAKVRLEVIDPSGKKLNLKKKIFEQTGEVSLEKLAPGMHTLRLITKSGKEKSSHTMNIICFPEKPAGKRI